MADMSKARLEAFSDGVMAVAITIMVLGIKAPEHANLAALRLLLEPFLTYALSFLYVGIYWNNHHHMMHLVRRVTPRLMWTNHLLLFSVTLVPLATAWVDEHLRDVVPTVVYGVSLIFPGIAFMLLAHAIAAQYDEEAREQRTLRVRKKAWLSLAGYLLGIAVAFVVPMAAMAIYLLVGMAWLIPERHLHQA